MRTTFIALLTTIVVLAICLQGNAVMHEPVKSRKLCDTIYSRGEDLATGEYYLIMDVICDTIEPTNLYPIGGGVGEP
jgi:hypothetical protein